MVHAPGTSADTASYRRPAHAARSVTWITVEGPRACAVVHARTWQQPDATASKR